MKNQISNLLTKVVFALFLFAAPVTMMAADKGKNPPAEIKYLGNVNDKPVFQIRFDNENAEELVLSLRDVNGVVIYSEVVKDKKYSRNIQLENNELDGLKFTLALRSKKSTRTQTFQVSRSVRITEDVQVAQVN
jgi:hypothetical protein